MKRHWMMMCLKFLTLPLLTIMWVITFVFDNDVDNGYYRKMGMDVSSLSILWRTRNSKTLSRDDATALMKPIARTHLCDPSQEKHQYVFLFKSSKFSSIKHGIRLGQVIYILRRSLKYRIKSDFDLWIFKDFVLDFEFYMKNYFNLVTKFSFCKLLNKRPNADPFSSFT